MNRKLHIGAISKDIINPTADEIEKSLTYLANLKEKDDPYCIFEVPNSGLNFIQIFINENDITLEYQNTDEVQLSTAVPDIRKIIEVFQEYNSGSINWISRFKWSDVDF
ncbi:MAG: hypothetical protein CMO71_08530 [Verrucomicrobiales bacterium]|nr:hypothetical protein [Verrucomicrobiales bacterium]|tara:strand:- start:140 stop:466 length:327 start_codon:yes stop_codon:yes gene_type:complete